MPKNRRRTSRHALILALLLCAGSLLAPHGTPAAHVGEDGPTPEQMEAYITAYREVERLRQKYLPRAEQADDRSERTRILHEAHMRFRGAIEDNGLTVEEYSTISLLLRRDMDLRQQATQRLVEPQ